MANEDLKCVLLIQSTPLRLQAQRFLTQWYAHLTPHLQVIQAIHSSDLRGDELRRLQKDYLETGVCLLADVVFPRHNQ